MADDTERGRVRARRSGGRIMRRGKRSDLNQRQYCEAEGTPLKASAMACAVQSRAAATGTQAALPASPA